MKQITIAVDDRTYRLTCEQAAATGKTVDELVREWLEDRVQGTPQQAAEPDRDSPDADARSGTTSTSSDPRAAKSRPRASRRVAELDVEMRFADTNVEIYQAGSEQLSPRSAGGDVTE